jgi:hypothetical protein
MRFRSKTAAFVLVTTLITGLWAWSEGISIAFAPVVVRDVTNYDKVQLADSYFGFGGYESQLELRKIAVIDGPFTKFTRVIVRMYVISDGVLSDAGGKSLGRTRNGFPSGYWETLQITVALGEKTEDGRTTTRLGCCGQSRGTASGGVVDHAICRRLGRNYPGQLHMGKTYLLHVVGDAEPPTDRETTVETLTNSRSGNFIVLTASLQTK